MTRKAIFAAAATVVLTTVALMTGAASAAGWSRLAAPAGVQALVGAQDVVIFDIRAPGDYAKGHVETAINAPYGEWRGPKDNPGAVISDAKLTQILQQAGVDPQDRVIITYEGASQTDFGAAARVYWTLKSAGLTRIAILNGGIEEWRKAGLKLSTAVASVAPSTAIYALSHQWMIDADGVAAVISGSQKAILVDARPEKFFTGEVKHKLAAWAGTLSGAHDLPFARLFGDSTRISADPEAIRALARAAGWRPNGPRVVSFCNTGHWAATNWFALSEIGGIKGVRLYPESMVGWTHAHDAPS